MHFMFIQSLQIKIHLIKIYYLYFLSVKIVRSIFKLIQGEQYLNSNLLLLCLYKNFTSFPFTVNQLLFKIFFSLISFLKLLATV